MRLLRLLVGIVSCCVFTFSSAHAAPSANRTTGVAPLSVFFDAGVAESTDESRPFHDYDYSWDFGDAGAGVWGTNGKSKNFAKGAVAAHVYDTPGTYTATLTVRNAGGILSTTTLSITVSDPDLFFSGTNTTCISDTTDNDFTGCPSGATHVTTDDVSQIATYRGSGKRVLLRRGSEWTYTGTSGIAVAGKNTHLGAFGNCESPDQQGICSNAPKINVSGTSSGALFSLSYSEDLRISDISLTGNTAFRSGFGGASSIHKPLIYRMKTRGFSLVVEVSTYRTSDDAINKEISIVDNDFRDSGLYGLYLGSRMLNISGNNIHPNCSSHAVRVHWSHLGVLNSNNISGASAASDDGRHALKLHGPIFSNVGTFAETGNSGVPSNTSLTIVSDNVFGGSGPWPLSVEPQNTLLDERLTDLIFERNAILADYGERGTSALVDTAMQVSARYVTIRNNIIDTSYHDAAPTSLTGIKVAKYGPEPGPRGIRIYNNTIYSEENLVNGSGVSLGQTEGDIDIKNNLISYPNAQVAISTLYGADEATLLEASGNITAGAEYFADCLSYPTVSRSFALTSSADSAIRQGVQTQGPLVEDFLGLPRYGAMDIGAFRASLRRLFRNIRVSAEVEP